MSSYSLHASTTKPSLLQWIWLVAVRGLINSSCPLSPLPVANRKKERPSVLPDGASAAATTTKDDSALDTTPSRKVRFGQPGADAEPASPLSPEQPLFIGLARQRPTPPPPPPPTPPTPTPPTPCISPLIFAATLLLLLVCQ